MRACVRVCICASFTSAAAAAAAALIDFSYTFLLSRTAAEISIALTLPLSLSLARSLARSRTHSSISLFTRRRTKIFLLFSVHNVHGTKTVQRLILIRVANDLGTANVAAAACACAGEFVAREPELACESVSETKRPRCCRFTRHCCCTAHPAAVVRLDWLRVPHSALRLCDTKAMPVRRTSARSVCVCVCCVAAAFDVAFLGWLCESLCVRACARLSACVCLCGCCF